MTNGYIRVAAVSPSHRVGDVQYNVDEIIKSMHELEAKGVEIAVFPELCISGYTCGDLFHNATLIEASKEGLMRIARETETLDLHVIVGLPIGQSQALYNCLITTSFTNGAGSLRPTRLTLTAFSRATAYGSVWRCVRICGLRCLRRAHWRFQERR